MPNKCLLFKKILYVLVRLEENDKITLKVILMGSLFITTGYTSKKVSESFLANDNMPNTRITILQHRFIPEMVF